MRQLKSILLASALLALFALPSHAAVHIVNCGNINALLGGGTVNNGDTIVVEPCGLYAGFSVIGWADLHFVAATPTPLYRGANAEGVLAAPAPPVVINEPFGTCVTIDNSTDISLIGFQLQNCGADGISITRSHQVTIEGNVITNIGGLGILANDTLNMRLAGNQISNTGNLGMHLTDTKECLVNDNEVLNTGNHGILLDGPGGHHTKVFNNYVNTTTLNGIRISDGAGHRAERNTVVAAGLSDFVCSGGTFMALVGNSGVVINGCGADVY